MPPAVQELQVEAPKSASPEGVHFEDDGAPRRTRPRSSHSDGPSAIWKGTTLVLAIAAMLLGGFLGGLHAEAQTLRRDLHSLLHSPSRERAATVSDVSWCLARMQVLCHAKLLNTVLVKFMSVNVQVHVGS